jgi:hypothetical protein
LVQVVDELLLNMLSSLDVHRDAKPPT